ncbi:TRDC protein, partial [Himantopus himantopus]|nr:TRDC protein [Himantopus himantopus]
MKSKKLEEDGNIEKAACLARKFNTKNISLEMSSDLVVYEQSTPTLTSEGLYGTIKVVNVTKGEEVTCTAKFNNRNITASALPEKEAEEPVTGKVCNTTDTSAQADTKVEKANMLSVAVLGLRVLLAKSIAFNTLMSIKLFLF